MEFKKHSVRTTDGDCYYDYHRWHYQYYMHKAYYCSKKVICTEQFHISMHKLVNGHPYK